ncbi:MAG: ABC transporter substrate-binding protein [Micromonosporaceae bacterium]
MQRTRAIGAGLAALCVATSLATACSPNAQGDQSSDTLVVARTGDLDVLDPSRATAFQTVQTMGLVYDTLIDTDDEGNLKPGLAEKWDDSDPESITFTLRDGVTFHNGEKLTAEDAKATLERNLDPETKSVVSSYLANIDSVEAPDETTLTINLKQPDASLLTGLSYTGNSILSAKDIEAGTVGKGAKGVNGTGPFAWEDWKQGQKLVLAANKKHWGGAPEASTVEFRVIPDEASIASGMKAGSFHLGLLTDPAVAKQINGGKAKLITQPTTSYHVLQLNSKRGPLRELEARQAIACAVDRDDVNDAVYFGKAQVTGPITSPAYDFSETDGLPCEPGDTEAAKKLLAKAGHPKGFSLDTIVMIGEYDTSTNIAQVLQSQLEKIGVTLNLERQQTNVYVDNWSSAKFDAAVALNGGSTDPYLIYNRYFTSDGSLTTPAAYGSDKLDTLLRDSNASTDEAEREQIFGDLQQQLLHDSPWVWLFRNQMHYAASTKLTGFKSLPTESLEHLRNASLSG